MELNQQGEEDSQENNVEEGEKQRDSNKNVDQSTSCPYILDGNKGNSLSTPSKSDNNNNITINDFPSTKQSSTTTTINQSK